METITLAGGCFWCTEAVFASLKGVEKVTPGYSGGKVENPGYYQVATGVTGHAESVQIVFDPKIISLETLLEVFFKLHNPTELNKQGADVGTQYRSAIFYGNNEQLETAKNVLNSAQKNYKDQIVTEITPYKNFYPAEEAHREYYFKNKGNVYCTLVIDPKINELRRDFAGYVKG